jgi:VCBS repeat-containing protein
LANDSDPDGNPLTVSAVNNRPNKVGVIVNGTFGKVRISANGRFTYTLNNNSRAVQALGKGQVVTDTFAYTASNNQGGLDTASLIIKIKGTDDRPQLSNIEKSRLVSKSNTTHRISGKIRVSDVDDSNMQRASVQISKGYLRNQDRLVIIGSLPKGISSSFDLATGRLLLTGSANKAAYQQALRQVGYRNISDNPTSGKRKFKFLVNDGDLNSKALSRRILVRSASVNEAPTAQSHVFNAIGNVPIKVNGRGGLLSGATDPEGDTITVNSIDTTGLRGKVTRLKQNGAFMFTPEPGFEGKTSFTYTLTDDGTPDVNSSLATVTINVKGMIWFVDGKNGSDSKGDGTLNKPFATFAPLNDNGADKDEIGDAIFLYQAGRASYDVQGSNGFVLENKQSLVGEGAKGKSGDTIGDFLGLATPKFSAPLPKINGQAPTVGNSLGDVIKLARGNFIAGLDLAPMAGSGIVGSKVNGSVVRDVSITGGTFGIDLDTTSGKFTFTNVDIVDPTDSGFRLNGGSANVTFDAKSSISTQDDFALAVYIHGNHTGSVRFDPGSQIKVIDGSGIALGDFGAVNGLDGQYDFLGSTLLSGPDASLSLFGNSSGRFTFGPDTLVTNSAAAARSGFAPAIGIGSGGFGNDTFTGQFDYNGTVDIFMEGGNTLAAAIDLVGPGGVVNFNNTGSNFFRAESNSLLVNAAIGEGIELTNINGTVNFDIPTTLVNLDKGINIDSFTPSGSTGSGRISFTDTTIFKNNDLAETGAIVVRNHSGTVEFTNLDLTMTTTTVDPVLVRRNPVLFFAEQLVDNFYVSDVGTLVVNGTSRIDATEAQALSFRNIGNLDVTFDSISVADNVVSEELGGQGFPNAPTGNVLPHNAIELSGIGGGSFHANRVDIARSSGSGIEIKDYAGTFTIDDGNPGTSDDLTIKATGVNNSGQPISNPNGITFAGIDISNSAGGTFTFAGVEISDTSGAGIRFDNVDGTFTFSGGNILNGGDAGIDIIGSTGQFTFSDTTITDPIGTAFKVDGGTADVTYSGGSITQGKNATTVNVQGGHTGTLNFGIDITATNGDGLQFDNADGTYNFNTMTGSTTLNGGDAGIDILGGSAGTFTFSDTTTITNPTGAAFNIQDLEAGGTVNYNGSIRSNNDVILSIDTTAAGSNINFITNGANFLRSNNNANGGIFIFDADGDITITTPTTIVNSSFSSVFATDGDGIWTFNDLTITGQTGLNGGIDLFGQQGTVNFTNLNITTNSAGTGDATTGFLAGGSNIINVMGNSSINADGGGALVLIDVSEVNMIFQDITSTNNLTSQIGFAGDDGIDLLNVRAGTIDVVGTTTVRNVDGTGVSIEGVGATVTFNRLDLDTIGLDGIISGVVFDNPGAININSGSFANIGGDGFRIGHGPSGVGVSGGFNLNNTSFTNITGFVGRVANSVLSGSGNTAIPFSSSDGGGNTGKILFNGGADSVP